MMDVKYLLSFLLALGLSWLIIPVLIRHSARLGLMDDPSCDDRKEHGRVMPRSGGLGIVLASALALVVVLPVNDSLLSLVAGGLVITVFGLIDDRTELKAIYKFLGQVIGVGIAMAGGMVITEVPFFDAAPDWFCYLLTFFFVVGVINAVNFSDGMDGLAAGTSLMALMLIFVLAAQCGNLPVAAISLSTSAAVLGFLRFNTHPASIFMGDAGSQFLGFIVAWLAISVSQADISPMTRLMPLLLLGIPVMDLLQVIPVRLAHGRAPWQPDRQNFHHQIAKVGFHQYEVVAIIYALQAVLLVSAFLLRFASDAAVLGFYLAYAGLILGSLYWANTHGWHVRVPRPANTTDRRNPLFRRLSGLHTYTGKFFGGAITVCFILAAVLSSSLHTSLAYIGLVWAGVLFVIKRFSRNRWPLALGRLATYTVTGGLVYGLTTSYTSVPGNFVINAGLVVLLVLLAVAIRITRRKYFWLTTQDLLVVFFLVILTPQLPATLHLPFPTDVMIFRTFALLYMCEYVLARGDSARARLTSASIFALLFVGLHL